MRTTALGWLILWLASTCATAGPVFYREIGGKDSGGETWLAAASSVEFARLREDMGGVEYFVRTKGAGGITRVTRSIVSPSGDHLMEFTYHYSAKGGLVQLHWNLRTFSGYDAKLDEFFLTEVRRTYNVDERGKLILESERITDVESGVEVGRSFYEPKVGHWCRLADVPEVVFGTDR